MLKVLVGFCIPEMSGIVGASKSFEVCVDIPGVFNEVWFRKIGALPRILRFCSGLWHPVLQLFLREEERTGKQCSNSFILSLLQCFHRHFGCFSLCFVAPWNFRPLSAAIITLWKTNNDFNVKAIGPFE